MSLTKIGSRCEDARMNAEMTFLEDDNEISRMQLTKEIAIAEVE